MDETMPKADWRAAVSRVVGILVLLTGALLAASLCIALASSSSGITMDVIQSACKRPECSVIGFGQQTFGMTAND
jgi:hypothetical protein